MAKLSDIYVSGVVSAVAVSGEYTDLLNKPDIAAIAPNRWTTTGVKTANYIAESAQNIPCDTSAGGFAITLPAVGNRARIFDAVGTDYDNGFALSGKNLTILPSAGATVMGSASFLVVQGGSAYEFELLGTDWRVSGGIVPIQMPYSVTFLDGGNAASTYA